MSARVATPFPGQRAGLGSLVGQLRVELLLFAFALFADCLSSWGMLLHQSQAPHFVWQADALLHGRLWVHEPPNLNDWVFQGGHWYVSFPPFPALLMVPLVALFGLGTNDTAFTVLFAALNVPLFYRLLGRLSLLGEDGIERRSSTDRAWLSLLFGFGTLAWSCGIRGEVWFTAETLGVTLTLCYLLCAIRAERPLLAGLFLGCAVITRTPLLFSGLFFLGEALLVPERRGEPAPRASLGEARAALADPEQRRLFLGRLLRFALPLVAIGVPMALANLARFGSPGEFGHSHLFNNRVNADIDRYGLFNYAYLERNLHAAFTRLPQLSLHPLHLGFDGHGMSLFVTTPLFFLLLWPRQTPRLHRLLWLTVAAVALPGLLYQNDGYFQFGFRFSLDYTPYLFALLALGGVPMDGRFWTLGFLGVLVNAWGAAVFNRFY